MIFDKPSEDFLENIILIEIQKQKDNLKKLMLVFNMLFSL